MGERHIILSERLQMLARMVTPGSRVADVGCDHGFLSIYLVQEGISSCVTAMDVRKGPLSAAREHIDARGLGAYIQTRISDGLQKLQPGEADTVVCAGMGGRLMERILTEGLEKAMQMRELILQPQSELREFRQFLRRTGFRVDEEDMVYEEGKYYFAMRTVPEGREILLHPDVFAEFFMNSQMDTTDYVRLCDKFGEKLLTKKHPLLEQYLRQQEKIMIQLAEKLTCGSTERARIRLEEVQQELEDIRLALKLYPGISDRDKIFTEIQV